MQEVIRTARYTHPRTMSIGPDGRPIAAYMVELALLTGTRISEIRKAEWQEINFETMIWDVPPGHTKWGERERNNPNVPSHLMPITTSMDRIFKDMEKMRTDMSPQALIFPSTAKRSKSTNNLIGHQTLSRTIQKYLLLDVPEKEITNHGLRTTLHGWIEANGKSEVWYERQIHHKPHGTTAQTKYTRPNWDYLEQRRDLMQEWDDYLNTQPKPIKTTGNIIELEFNKKRRA
jgi:integrase